jgi:putative oxygen-independent coproporphyrinogen III oxidase
LILHNSDIEKNISVYVHWPFCLSKCPYCDFNSHTFDVIDHNVWQQSYLKEIEYFSDILKEKQVVSIFFGGGTPSLMQPAVINSIINKIASYAKVTKDTEITMEANPTSVESGKFLEFKSAGINRMSLGIQSFNPKDLKFLGRKHDEKEAIEAIKIATKHFDNYSFDLIYARPDQDLKSWKSELELAISLSTKHISLYQLTIEKGTPFYSMYQKGHFKLPDQDTAIDLYDLTNNLLASNDYHRYEISNYAKRGFESKHNLTYWTYGEYLGIGPGAHSRLSFYDATNKQHKMQAMEIIYNPQNWLKSVQEHSHGIKALSTLSQDDTIKEILMMGLRLTKGISNEKLEKFADKNFDQLLDQGLLEQLFKAGLIDFDDKNYFLTNQGLALHSRIVSQIFAKIG